MKNEKFTCICGKSFNSKRSLAAHKAGCKEHYLKIYGNLDKYYERKNNISKSLKGFEFDIKTCPYCGRKISKNTFNKHIKCHENGNFEKRKSKTQYHLDHDDLFCKFCRKECKNKNSLRQHEIRCKNNPNRITTNFSNSVWRKKILGA